MEGVLNPIKHITKGANTKISNRTAKMDHKQKFKSQTTPINFQMLPIKTKAAKGKLIRVKKTLIQPTLPSTYPKKMRCLV